MKSLIFDSIPLDIGAAHDAKGETSGINGGYVFYHAAVRAILEYSRYDRFVFLSRRERHPFSFANTDRFKSFHRDIRIIHPTELTAQQEMDQAVLATSTERLGPLLRARRLFEPLLVPVTGFLCATHPAWFGPFLVEMVLAGVSKIDTLICSSIASRTVLHTLMDLLQIVLDEKVNTPLIPMAVDAREFKGRDEEARKSIGYADDEVVILYFGRMEMSGKADLGPLLLAFSRLRRTTQCRIRLVLAGAERTKVAELIAQFARDAGCADAVDIHSNPSQQVRMKLFSTADIFVSPGDGVPESFGLTPVEAMASGLPCVLSDWNGYRETIVPGKTGFLVPTSWSNLGPCAEAFENCMIQPVSTLAATTVLDLDALESYLKLLVEDPNLRRSMGSAARESVAQNFDWSVVVPKYDDLFDLQLSLARQSGPLDEGRRRLAQLSSMQNLFSHYPTQTIQPDSPIFLTESGKGWMQSPFTLGAAMAKNELIDDSLCLQIAEVLQAESVLTFGELVRKASAHTGAAPWMVQINLMRLLKYGMAGRSEPRIESLQDSSELMPAKEN